MSIAIGDILALTQLAWNLYRKCYVVGKDAPSEFLNLTSEIATLSQSLKMLEEELANPESILVRAGEDRQRMVAEMVRRVGGTLGELERFAGKYAGLGRGAGEKGEKGGGGGWRKRFWEKFKWSLDAADMEGLRSKLVYHNGVISLLLTSVGNSSLQRIEENHGRLERKLSEINQYVQKIGDNSRLPASQSISPSTTINSNHPSHIDDPTLSTLRSPVLSAILMKNAEVGERRWSAIGIDEWIQAGKWWLLKSQATTQISEEGKRQRYVDLLKASWIVVDVVAKHPQLNSLDPGAQVEAALLAEVRISIEIIHRISEVLIYFTCTLTLDVQ
ncbi:hypothetical protein DFH27DRAFT_488134 [Peziza echinospora]|nr:hypothetical protein DFH27DRAFT_488134 [Peziza echinospora]